MTRRKLITMSVASAIMVTAMGVHAPSVEAKSLRLTSKKVTLTVGKSKTIKVRGAKKVTWKVAWGSKCIRLSNKKKTSVKITAKKEGSAKIQAKAGKKRISCRVTVNPKTTVLKMNVNKVDDATVKKVHETLSQGNTLRVRIQGGNQSQRVNTMDNLRDAVGKYNEYGVLPQVSSSTKKYYTEWEADKELAGQYKWGLLLVKDIISRHKNDYVELKKTEAEMVSAREATLKEKYKYEGEEWKKTFEEVTGIPYKDNVEYGDYSDASFNYKDGQVAKNSKNELLPDGYYYVTYKIDGKEVTRTAEVESFFKKKDWDSYYYDSAEYLEFKDKIDKEYDVKWGEKRKQLEEEIKQREEAGESIDQYTRGVLLDTAWKEIEDEKTEKLLKEEGKRFTEYYSKTDNWYFDIYGKHLSFNDITFHYEPLKVDLNAVNTAINTKITTELNTFKSDPLSHAGSAEERLDKLLHDNKFCDLSPAVQQYWIQEIFGGDGDYTAYEDELGVKLGANIHSPVNPKGRIHGEGGAEGLRLLYQCKWMGICSNYASAEMTVYRLFGLEATRISCDKCNHEWTVVKLTNSDGDVSYVRNDYGLKYSYSAMPSGCTKHDKSKNDNVQYLGRNFKYN